MSTNNYFKLSGLRFYKYDKNDKPIILALRYFDTSKKEYKMINTEDKSEINIPYSELHRDWVKLNNDGVIIMSSCYDVAEDGSRVPDVFIALYKNTTENTYNIPLAICRQNVISIDPTTGPIGMSINITQCDIDIYSMYLGTEIDPIKKTKKIAVYDTDTLDDILSTVNTNRYDMELKTLKSINNGNELFCSSVRELLETKRFMYDFHTVFNIHELNVDKITNNVMIKSIIDINHEVPRKMAAIKYTKFISLKDLNMYHYVLVTRKSNKYHNDDTYIVLYIPDKSIQYKDMVNKGKDFDEAKIEVMNNLGWR